MGGIAVIVLIDVVVLVAPVVLVALISAVIIVAVVQYFTVPPLFLSESGHSSGIWWNLVESSGMGLESTGIHWTPLDSTRFWSHKTIIQNKSVYSSPIIPI